MHTGNRAKILGQRGGRKHYKFEEMAPLPPPRTAEDVVRLVSETISDLRAGRIDARLSNSICYAVGPLLNALELADLSRQLALAEGNMSKDELDAELSRLIQSVMRRGEGETGADREPIDNPPADPEAECDESHAGRGVSGASAEGVAALAGRFGGKTHG